MKQHNIRKVEERDIEQLIQLCADHAVYEGSGYDAEGKAANMVRHLIGEDATELCYVVELNNQLIGYTTFV